MAYAVSTAAWDAKRAEGDKVAIRMGVEKIWKGSACMINGAGYLVMASDTATADMFAGIAAETKDNRYKVENDADSGGATAGDKYCEVWADGVFEMKHAGAAITDMGLPAFLSLGTADANQTVLSATVGTHAMMIGQIVGMNALVSATRVLVRINGFALCGSPAAAVNGGYTL